MERRRALTLPLGFDKDNLMESPLRIPVTCLSSDCEKFERQVSWTELAGCKHRLCDSQHRNGSMLFDHHHAAVVTLEMSRRTPCLILTDILKTELGRSYMQRINQSCNLENEGQEPCKQSSSGRCRRDRQICKEIRSNQKKPCNDTDIVTPKSTPKTSPTLSQRFGLRRRLINLDDEVDKDEKDIQEVIIGKDDGEDCNFAEVVDVPADASQLSYKMKFSKNCGLSVSWEPAEDEISPSSIKDRWSDQEKELQPNAKRRKKDAGFQCNGTISPKRLRESVLRLNGEDRRDGGLARPQFCLEGSEEEGSGGDGDLDCLDRSIVQFTVGADDPAEVLVPISPDLDAGDLIGTHAQSPSCNQHNTSKTSPTEPIVLSSDDEDSCDVPPPCSPAVHTLVTVEDTVIQRQCPQEAVLKPSSSTSSDSEDSQVLHAVVHNITQAPFTSDGDTCLNVAFSTLHCGGYRGKSSGDITIADQKVIIPLQGTSEQAGMITLERKEIRRYSVWEQQEMEAQEVCFTGDEDPLPPAVLLLCLSDAAAAAVQRDLVKLCAKHNGSRKAGKVSPFILLTLRDDLKGMEGALLRSYLDMDCLNSIAHEKSIDPPVEDGVSGWGHCHNPVLSMDESVELIQSVGLDSHLLCLLGLERTEGELNTDQNGPHTETDNGTPLIQLEIDSDKGTQLELETAAKGETGTEPEPEEDQDKQDLEHPSEKQKKEPAPVYTVCHRRTKASYSVSLCKLDSRWTRYKHQGPARRLIQFPPPPLKGGITVTMEDLQCLDSRQFLNDVIIDFYLKYILHKASAAVAERSHIFSSFFFKQLTRRDNASEGNTTVSGQRQRRHQRVKTWTRHVDIFKKDFLFVPVNQEAHWYMAVICFPGLSEPKHETWNGPNSQTEKNHLGTDELKDHEEAKGAKSLNDTTAAPATPPTSNPSDNADTENAKESTKDHKPGPVSCTEKTYQKKTICKRPCILIMDSLKRSPHERVFKLLRDYLESEWEARRGSPRDFSPDVMQSSHCHVPLQDNSSDCGLYLLQYVESFLKDPVVHFDLPLHLERWFPRQQVRRKRDEIRDLVLNLYRRQNVDSNR